MARGNILIVDDEKNIVAVLAAILEKNGFETIGYTDPQLAITKFRDLKVDAVITDLNMPSLDGMQFMAMVHHHRPEIPVIMITAYGTVDSAVEAMKKGAFDYVTKPFEKSEIISVAQKAINTKRIRQLEVIPGGFEFPPLLQGKGPKIQNVQQFISRVVNKRDPVLIIGEPGTGKDLIAEQIHKLSGRAQNNLIRFNCSAVPGSIQLDELCGSEKPGRLEMADKGTLCIEDIAELTEDAQLLLYNFIETGFFEHKRKRKNVDVRLIVSSELPLSKLSEDGTFNKELLFRLSACSIVAPSLRNRLDDIPDLVEMFIEKFNKKYNKQIKSVEPVCIEIFQKSHWPGNLRQLESIIEAVMRDIDSEILTLNSIPDQLKSELEESVDQGVISLRAIVKQQTKMIEKDLIEKALANLDGNVTRTAQYLGLSRKGLQLKIKELGITTKYNDK